MPETLYVATFKGRPANDLTREELIEAYTVACQELTQMRQWISEHHRMDQVFEDARRRINARPPINLMRRWS